MGGYGSGQRYGRPTADASRRIDLAWMIRKRLALPGAIRGGDLSWTRGDQPAGRIGFTCDMRDPEQATLVLQYTITESSETRDYTQRIRLSYTQPHYGGKRWWMHCPVNGQRVGKLYMPPGAETFASRTVWRLGYQSQRVTRRDAVFERLFRLQKKLGCPQGWESPIRRPKGMHHRTYARLEDEYEYLDNLCAAEMMHVIGLLKERCW
ncbi:MAG: hypothetical protein GW858_08260 [Sphingomonadales bacterium]|nr:hypothetical protein [Sphingomonadales bacterium]NCQ21020.1 hypothetical protein [Sphingomonadales bacterium]NCT03809.1 hypothetical protein [Sphingomonadales bacterium]